MSEAAINPKSSSYGQILDASSLVGGAEAVSVILGFARMKFAAVLIGTVGVGLAGTYMAIQSLVGTLAGLGVQTSAVRDITTAAASGDELRIAETVSALRRLVWFTGLLGAFGLAGMSPWLSRWTFGSGEYTIQIAALGLLILFANLQGGQMVLIQGMRRIGDLARVRIYSGFVTTVFTIGCYWSLGLRGIIPALVGAGFLNLCVSTLYARRVKVPRVRVSWARALELSGGMIRLGLAFMWTALLTTLVAYITRAIITQKFGLAEVGLFAAAFTLSGIFVNFVLNAMGADYYPRLTAVASDPEQIRKLVNEQTEIGILISLPGLLFMIALAPWLVSTFYTADFLPAADLLPWFILGCVGRVISWPIGFIFIAKGQARLFAILQTATNVLHLGLIWIGLNLFGLLGSAIAFATLYLINIAVVRIVAGSLVGFSWSSAVRSLIVVSAAAAASVLASGWIPNDSIEMGVGLLLATASGFLCARALFRRLDPAHRLTRFAARIPAGRYLFDIQVG